MAFAVNGNIISRSPPLNDYLLQPDSLRTHRYITTSSGVRVMCPGMRSSMVNMADIAHSLAMQVRYLGHVRLFYSVADHSILVSQLAEEYGEPLHVIRACFLHDAHEAYIGDFPSPFKKVVPGLSLFEKSIEAAVRDALNLPPDDNPIWDRVKHYDIMALHIEGSVLFTTIPPWVDRDIAGRLPAHIPLTGRGWQEGEAAFIQRHLELGIS